MKNHTTFRVGGPADYFVAPHTEEEIRKIVALCEEKEIPWFVTGNGSNLVVSDEGYHGVILSVYKNFQGIEVERNRIRAKAGSMLVSISQAAREAGLSGMEFASGIPGTLGGGVRMNAGAYGGEMKDIIVKVLPETDVERTFVPVKKMAITAKKYPRKAGLPGKEPLK